jgi:SAM-dependent methyltransferase
MEALAEYRSRLESKPVVKVVYRDFFRRLAAHRTAGATLEVGGGRTNAAHFLPNVISSDIQFSPLLDIVADAQALPFPNGALGNIVMVDVLHHIEYPLNFFREAARVLRPGGRIIMVEPAITWGSFLFYRFLHQEPVIMSADPLVAGSPQPDRDPYASNQAIPTLLATRDAKRLAAEIPGLRLTEVQWFSFAVYPLSGGFKRWSLVSPKIAEFGLRLERRLEPLLGRIFGFRLLLTIEKDGAVPSM